MSKKRPTFPMDVPNGSVTVKIYRVRNKAYRFTTKRGEVKEKARFNFMVSYFAGGKRRQQMFANYEEAYREAKSKADKLSRSELDALEWRAVDARAYVSAVEAMQPTRIWRWNWPQRILRRLGKCSVAKHRCWRPLKNLPATHARAPRQDAAGGGGGND